MALNAAQKNQHSFSAREAFSTMPSLSRKYTNFHAVKGLVRISAICSSVRMYYNFRVPLCTRSLMKWYFISMCFDLSWNTGFFESLMQLWLLQWMIVESSFPPNRSDRRFLSQVAFFADITCNNILCLNCTLSYETLFPVGPRDHCRSHTEAVTRGAFLVYCTANPIWINISC